MEINKCDQLAVKLLSMGSSFQGKHSTFYSLMTYHFQFLIGGFKVSKLYLLLSSKPYPFTHLNFQLISWHKLCSRIDDLDNLILFYPSWLSSTQEWFFLELVKRYLAVPQQLCSFSFYSCRFFCSQSLISFVRTYPSGTFILACWAAFLLFSQIIDNWK